MSTLSQARGVALQTGASYKRQVAVKMRSHYAHCSKVIGYVADRYDVPVSLIRGGGNQRSLVAPRHIAMFLCKDLLGMSLSEIGQAFGGYHHTTVIHALQKVEAAQGSQDVAAFLDEAREELRNLPKPRRFSCLYVPTKETA